MKPKYLDNWMASYYIVTYFFFLKSNNFIRFFILYDIYIYLLINLFKILLQYLIYI